MKAPRFYQFGALAVLLLQVPLVLQVARRPN